jgi:aryl-alcohol dehydrogenase-like predicted oxidoreductase
LGALAFQYSLRNPNITVVLCGPRDAEEVAANVRHAQVQFPDSIWAELDAFVESLGPAAPGGEVDPKGA